MDKNIILTDKERARLEKALDMGYRWIARDSDGRIFGYSSKPYKDKAIWWRSEDIAIRLYDEYLFIKWEDDEPMSIEELLNNSKPKEEPQEETQHEKTPKEWLLTQLAVCTTRNGTKFIVIDNCHTPMLLDDYIGYNYCSNLENRYDDNLVYHIQHQNDIMKIEYNGQVVWERKKPVKIAEDERLELTYMKALGMNYIARDCDNKVYAFETKPCKADGYWIKARWKMADLGKYEFIKNRDTEPVLIEDILNNCVVEG